MEKVKLIKKYYRVYIIKLNSIKPGSICKKTSDAVGMSKLEYFNN